MPYIVYIFKLFFLFLLFTPRLAYTKSYDNQINQLIVLFHGLGNHAASFHTIKQELEQTFPAASVVALTSVEGAQSVELSIKQQAEMNFKELASKVENLQDKSILLVGHSQGGLRAYTFLKQYESLLSIKGLITLAAPWEGAPGARVDAAMLSAHLTNPVLADLRRLSLTLGYPEHALEEQLMFNIQSNQAVCVYPGGKDLMAGSVFLNELQALLRDEKIPILAIGGGQSDLRALLKKKSTHRFKALHDMYTFFVVGEKYFTCHHDMQLPLDSQHALHVLCKKKKNFKRVFIKDAFHSSHVLAIPVPKSKNILSHPRVLDAITKFAKNLFKAT
ncbi:MULTISPECIES: alpha/beta hydrolase [unclassified Candidatus Cardinium]|uniref:alpha/beta hydrolase n=1 Tax=unclassified Candidatus Cardinium TaxID=2641185 RepID=UPI001FB2CAD8|nr:MULTISPECIES: alpha/beta hydrolase [unclassified Candidatus Cardinium]